MARHKINEIPIDQPIIKFDTYIKENDRIIFSAKFGDGKSYFLSKFMKSTRGKKYIFIPIYPVNYQVADNKDIFEYIKRDILIRLLMIGEIDFSAEEFTPSLKLYSLLQTKGVEIGLELLKALPEINLFGIKINLKSIRNIIEAYENIKEKYDEHSTSLKSDEKKIQAYINQHEPEKGSIYEFDFMSQIICDTINYIKKKKKKKVVLLIEDLDRIDPAHIFRILNIFSVHIDWYNVHPNSGLSTEMVNKFNFDKVVTVCDYDNIKSIYHHLYGEKTDFDGYIGKFSSNKPFMYSIHQTIYDHIFDNVHIDLKKYPCLINELTKSIISKIMTGAKLKVNLRSINTFLCCSNDFIDVNTPVKIEPKITDHYINEPENIQIQISTNCDLTKFLCLVSNFGLTKSELAQIYFHVKAESEFFEMLIPSIFILNNINNLVYNPIFCFDKNYRIIFNDGSRLSSTIYPIAQYYTETNKIGKYTDFIYFKEMQPKDFPTYKKLISHVINYFDSYLVNPIGEIV